MGFLRKRPKMFLEAAWGFNEEKTDGVVQELRDGGFLVQKLSDLYEGEVPGFKVIVVFADNDERTKVQRALEKLE